MQMPDELGTRIGHELSRARVPGCSIVCGRGDGSVTRFEHGLADLSRRRPVEATTPFHLFSGTKLYTATALMLLAERRQLALDESVREHLPELPLRDDLSIRHLASHRSGLPDTLRAFLSVHLADEPAPTTREALARYRLEGAKAPGGKARYGNVNYAILGELISRVSGRPYETFVRDAILEPLASGACFAAEGERGDDALGYVPRLSPMRPLLKLMFPEIGKRIIGDRSHAFVSLRPFSLDCAAIGGLCGSAADFFPLVREMLSREDGVLRADSKREMLTLQGEGAVGIVSREGAGLGWKRGRTDGVTFWNHEGGGPGYCSETRLYPDADLGLVILMNRSQSRGLSRLCHRIGEMIRAALSPRS